MLRHQNLHTPHKGDSMLASLRIFSDFSCPYCYLAKAMVETLTRGMPLSPLWIPLELHPEIPASGISFQEKYPGLEIQAFFHKMARKGEPYGISFCGNDKLVNSGRAIQAAEFARDNGCFDSFHKKIFYALFENNENIGDPEVLRKIARSQNLNPAAMDKAIDSGLFESRLRTAAIEAAERNIRMVPTFVVPGMLPFVGLPSKEKMMYILKRAMSL